MSRSQTPPVQQKVHTLPKQALPALVSYLMQLYDLNQQQFAHQVLEQTHCATSAQYEQLLTCYSQMWWQKNVNQIWDQKHSELLHRWLNGFVRPWLSAKLSTEASQKLYDRLVLHALAPHMIHQAVGVQSHQYDSKSAKMQNALDAMWHDTGNTLVQLMGPSGRYMGQCFMEAFPLSASVNQEKLKEHQWLVQWFEYQCAYEQKTGYALQLQSDDIGKTVEHLTKTIGLSTSKSKEALVQLEKDPALLVKSSPLSLMDVALMVQSESLYALCEQKGIKAVQQRLDDQGRIRWDAGLSYRLLMEGKAQWLQKMAQQCFTAVPDIQKHHFAAYAWGYALGGVTYSGTRGTSQIQRVGLIQQMAHHLFPMHQIDVGVHVQDNLFRNPTLGWVRNDVDTKVEERVQIDRLLAWRTDPTLESLIAWRQKVPTKSAPSECVPIGSPKLALDAQECYWIQRQWCLSIENTLHYKEAVQQQWLEDIQNAAQSTKSIQVGSVSAGKKKGGVMTHFFERTRQMGWVILPQIVLEAGNAEPDSIAKKQKKGTPVKHPIAPIYHTKVHTQGYWNEMAQRQWKHFSDQFQSRCHSRISGRWKVSMEQLLLQQQSQILKAKASTKASVRL